MMNSALQSLLNQTSRSFGLSIKLLPKGMRDSVGIAYLCARLSDTIADEGAITGTLRLELLKKLAACYQKPSQIPSEELKPLMEIHALVENPNEAALVTQLPTLLLTLAQLPDLERAQIQAVLEPIIEGQKADIERFELDGLRDASSSKLFPSKVPHLLSLESEDQLLTYCWQVAGCVGEFWGNLGRITHPQAFASEKNLPELTQLGANYGQALQLINILRDLPEDAQNGRCYLPGVWQTAQQAWEQSGAFWLKQARTKLEAATTYCANLRDFRLRLATTLPAAIGWKTLQLLECAQYSQLEARLKISRKEVYQLLLRALWASRSRRTISAFLHQLSQQ